MTPDYFALDRSPHLCGRLGLAFRPQTPGNLIEIGFTETVGGPQENPVARFFDCEFSAHAVSLIVGLA